MSLEAAEWGALARRNLHAAGGAQPRPRPIWAPWGDQRLTPPLYPLHMGRRRPPPLRQAQRSGRRSRSNLRQLARSVLPLHSLYFHLIFLFYTTTISYPPHTRPPPRPGPFILQMRPLPPGPTIKSPVPRLLHSREQLPQQEL